MLPKSSGWLTVRFKLLDDDPTKSYSEYPSEIMGNSIYFNESTLSMPYHQLQGIVEISEHADLLFIIPEGL